MERGAAKRSLVVLAIAVVLIVGLVGALRQFFLDQRQKALMSICFHNVFCIAVSFNMYTSDWDERLPPLYTSAQRAPVGQSWLEVLALETGREHPHMPCFWRARRSRSNRQPVIYSYNRRLAGMPWWKFDHLRSTILVFDSVNDSQAALNLNGDFICRPDRDHLPVIGSYVVWPKKGYWYYRDWPDWAKPIHGGEVQHLVCCDGHAQRVQGWDDQYTFSPSERKYPRPTRW